LLAAAAVWNQERGVVLSTCLLAVAVIAALAIPIQWSELQARRREPQVQHMGFLAALLVEWVGSGVVLALAVGYRLISARKQTSV
jgi:hypothetical protein